MNEFITRVMLAVALLFAPLALTACETTQNVTGLTPAQNLYRAHGTYNIALGTAVTYAESKWADPAIVSQMTEVNRRVKPAFEYAEAVVACAGPSNSGNLVITVANARCSVLDISPENVNKQAGYLNWAKSALFNLLKKGT